MNRSRSSSFDENNVGSPASLSPQPQSDIDSLPNKDADAVVLNPKATELIPELQSDADSPPKKPTKEEVLEPHYNVEPVSSFLSNCHCCNKTIAQNDIAYLYGDFQVFCTPECRDEGISIDKSKSAENKIGIRLFGVDI